MDLTFVINEHGKFLSVEGKITAWNIESSVASLTVLKIQMDLTNHKISKEGSITPVIHLPGLRGDGWARISGATDYDLKSKVFSKSRSLTVDFHLCGFYSSYEAACAAEMKSIMERK